MLIAAGFFFNWDEQKETYNVQVPSAAAHYTLTIGHKAKPAPSPWLDQFEDPVPFNPAALYAIPAANSIRPSAAVMHFVVAICALVPVNVNIFIAPITSYDQTTTWGVYPTAKLAQVAATTTRRAPRQVVPEPYWHPD
jgi:hypothetical protein